MWLIFSIGPHQDDHSALEPSQANKPLLAIRFPIVLSGEHGLIENTVALRQIDPMFAQIELSLGGVVAHVLFIVYAINRWRKRVAEQAVAADRDTQSLARRKRGIWIEVGAAQLAQDRMAIFLPGESPDHDVFAAFNPKVVAEHTQVSAAQRAAYAEGEPGKVLLFGHAAHVLHYGKVAFDRRRILSV